VRGVNGEVDGLVDDAGREVGHVHLQPIGFGCYGQNLEQIFAN
jgi:hypothetical protein